MCGIVGYVGNQRAKGILIDGLKKLEYRGYDSAGMAIFSKESNDFVVKRCVGEVKYLEEATVALDLQSGQGIAHTRWATHGVPSEINAHPHRAGQSVLVCNGIVENHGELRRALQAEGYEFKSQTDTEVLSCLLESCRKKVVKNSDTSKQTLEQKKQDIFSAIRECIKLVEGQFAALFMVQGIEGYLFGAQMGAPLVVGRSKTGNFVASDMHALLDYTKEILIVPNNHLFAISQDSTEVFAQDEKTQAKKVDFETIEWDAERLEKGGYETYMLKEIMEQPQVVANSLSGRLPSTEDEEFIWDNQEAHKALWSNIKAVHFSACGTAYYAALTAKYLFERWARLPTEVELASEFRYRYPVLTSGVAAGVVSQSGETADTLAALRLAKELKRSTFSICNVRGSTIMRESDFQYVTKAGPEIGVASTKAFTTQLAVLTSMAQDVARLRGYNEEFFKSAQSLYRLPHDMEKVLGQQAEYRKIGATLKDKKSIFFLGRGLMYPIALEGALKLKEITYYHAEGYAAGEMKHGPISLVDENLAAIVLSPNNELLKKTLSNAQEIKSRGASIIGIGEEACDDFREICDEYITMPKVTWDVAPILYVLPLQLIAYGLAEELGRNIDKPRNLAKSVTVE